MEYIYAIRAGDFVKIGLSANPKLRLQTAAVMNPMDVELVGCFKASREIEKRIHEQFSSYHVKGEWFRCDGSVLKWLKVLPPFKNEPPKDANGSIAPEKWTVVEAIAKDLGVKDDTIRKWKEPGRSIPARLHIPLINASRGKLKLSDFVESEAA